MDKQCNRYKKDSEIIAYIRKHKKARGISKDIVDFYTEYKLIERK